MYLIFIFNFYFIIDYFRYLSKLEDSQSYKSNATFKISSPNVNEIFPWEPVQEGTAIVNISLDNSLPLNSFTPHSAKIVASHYSNSSYAGVCFSISVF